MLIGRRKVLLATGALLAAPAPGFGVEANRVRRIGCLNLAPATSNVGEGITKRLRAALRGAGLEEGRNLVVDWRWGDGDVSRLPALAADLVGRKVELIVAVLNDEIIAAMNATRTIPIVMLYGCLPVELGLVASLRRPGGNVTGTTWTSPETTAKSLELLKEVKPSVRQISVLANFAYPGMEAYRAAMDHIAPALDMRLEHFDARNTGQLAVVLQRIAASRPDALYFAQDPVLEPRMAEIAAFALDRRLLSVGSTGAFVGSGGLLAYDADAWEILGRAARIVDRVLRGARPADIPIEEPIRFVLSINLRTANAIGVTVPDSVMLRASSVVR